MKITERQIIQAGLQMLEDTENDEVFRIAHTLRNKACRKNHPDWIKPILEHIKKWRKR